MNETPKVFISLTFEESEKLQMDYLEMPKDQALKENKDIIQCSYCDKDAIQLDTFFPYHNELTTCQEHKGEYDRQLGSNDNAL